MKKNNRLILLTKISIFLITLIITSLCCQGFSEAYKINDDFSANTEMWDVSIKELGLAESAWPCKGHDSKHTGQSPYVGAQSSNLKWTFKTGGSIESSPVIGADGTVYIGSRDKKIYALNPNALDDTERLKWLYETDGGIVSTPAIDKSGTIYVGSKDHFLYAIDTDSGEIKWRCETESDVDSSPAINSVGIICFGNANELYAVDPNGQVKVNIIPLKGYNSSPAIDNDILYFIDHSPYYDDYSEFAPIIAFDTQLNEESNFYYLPNNELVKFTSSIAIAPNGKLYVGSENGTIYASNYPESYLSALYQTQGIIYSTPAIGNDGTVYVGSDDGTLYALDPAAFFNQDQNIVKWSYQTEGEIRSSPAIGADGTIYFGSLDKNIYALDPNGDLKWSYQTEGEIDSSPAIGADGTVYIGSDDEKLYAFGENIIDAEPPRIICSADLVVFATGNLTKVSYTVKAIDPIDGGSILAECDPPSGTSFEKGTTIVNVDACNSSESCNEASFNIIIGSRPSGIWACRGYNAQHTAQSTNPGAQENTLHWRFSTKNSIHSSAIIASDGTLYIGNDDGVLYTIDSTTGAQKWRYPAQGTIGPIASAPALGVDGTIYVGSKDGGLYAITPEGNLKWKYQTEDDLLSSPVVGADGTIFVGCENGKVYAVNKNGTPSWDFQTNGGIYSSPALGIHGTVYIGNSVELCALTPREGSQKWNFTIPGAEFHSSPAVDSEGNIYIGSSNDNLYALDPNGQMIWNYDTGDDVDSSPAIGNDGTIYVGNDEGILSAFNTDGEILWSYKTNGAIWSSPAVGSGCLIFFGSNDGYVYALNSDGSKKWKFQTEGQVTSSPAIGNNGQIYVGSTDGNIYAIGAGQGSGNLNTENTKSSDSSPKDNCFITSLSLPLYHMSFGYHKKLMNIFHLIR